MNYLLDCFKKNLIPKKIIATVNFPEDVVLEAQRLKDLGENINDEMSFISSKTSKYWSFHSGAVNFLQGKTVELTYGSEGNWFAVSTQEMRKFEGFKNYFYNFEQCFIKPDHLIDIQVIEFGFKNERGDGLEICCHKQAILEASLYVPSGKIENINFNLEKMSLKEVREKFEEIFSSFKGLKCENVSFDNFELETIPCQKNLNFNGLKPIKYIHGIVEINEDSTIARLNTLSNNKIHFTISVNKL